MGLSGFRISLEIPDKKDSFQIIYQNLQWVTRKFRILLVEMESRAVGDKIFGISLDDTPIRESHDDFAGFHS